MKFEKFNRSTIYLGLLIIIIISISLMFFIKNGALTEKSDYVPQQQEIVIKESQSEEKYPLYRTEKAGLKSSDNFPQIATALEGYLWNISNESNVAFLYPKNANIHFCSDVEFCENMDLISGSIIITVDPPLETIRGEKFDKNSIKKDLFGIGIEVTPNSGYDEIANNPEISEELRDGDKYFRDDIVVLSEEDIGEFEINKKILTPIYIRSLNGTMYYIGPYDMDTHQKICLSEAEENCLKLSPTENKADYEKLSKYIETIVKSFTVLE